MILLFSIVSIGLGTWFVELGKPFNQTPDEVAFLNKSQSILGNVSSIEGIINQTDNEVSVVSVIAITSNAFIEALKLVFFVPSIMASIIADVGSIFLLPSWLSWGIVIIVTVVIIFQFLSSLGKFRT